MDGYVTASILRWPAGPISLGLGSALHLLIFFLVFWHCLRNPREPRSTLLWIFVTWSFPVVGALLYLTFGINRAPVKGWHKQHSDHFFMTARSRREEPSQPLAYWRTLKASIKAQPEAEAREFDGILDRISPNHPLLGGNRIEVFSEGERVYAAMLRAIESARRHVHVQTYILGPDDIGRRFLDALAEKARAGVRVRLLYDQFGSMEARMRLFFRRWHGVPNLSIVGFTQANFVKRQFQLNLRNHRKIMVVDGKTGFTGGMNLHGGHVSTPESPQIRDYHFRVEGAVVSELQYTFLRDWYYMTDESADDLLHTDYFPAVPSEGGMAARLINSGPTSEREAMTDAYFAAILAARKQILITTPYFIPPDDIRRALRAAALRGVDVKVMLPKHNNHLSAAYAARAVYAELLKAGVRIFERPGPLIHAKAMLVDDLTAMIGSANLDIRSLRLSYETNLIVFDRDFAAALKQALVEDFSVSEERSLGEWLQRPASQRLVENFFNLMSPVL